MDRPLLVHKRSSTALRRLRTLACALACLLLIGATSASASDGHSLWQALSEMLRQPLVLCLLTIACGMGLGSVQFGDVSLGTSGVLFAGLIFGHVGRLEGWRMPPGIGTLGLVLFVYAVGLGAGPTFFRTFRDQGRQLAILGVITVAIGAVCTGLLAWAWQVPGELATGIFAGSLTSTPALASGIDAATESSREALAVSIGYGLSYPVGVVGVVLFVQLLPRILRINMTRLGEDMQQRLRGKTRIDRFLVRISNPTVFGKHLHEIPLLEQVSGQITRVLEGDQLVPIRPDHIFAPGQVVLLVTDSKTAELLTMLLGEPTTAKVIINADRDRAIVVVTSHEVLNKPLRELHLRSKYGITVARIERYGVDFVPNAETAFSMADRVTVVGEPEGLKQFERAAGHQLRRAHETDLMSLAIGLVVGIVIGMIPLRIPGLQAFTLGMAGGPLLAGLLFAHFGRCLGIVGHMPIAARIFTQNIGLALFLATAGYDAGGHFWKMVQTYGATPFLMSIVVTSFTITAGFLVARYALRMDLMQSLGGMCGAMTSTAGIGAVTNRTDCDVPVTSYAAAYPAALVMMTIGAHLLLRTLSGSN
ncbi:MAG: aspartate:alanine exchanger family transporter [Pirellulaceae bacterium]